MAEDDLVPAQFDTFTIVLLVRPPDPPSFEEEEELQRLQVAHLTYLRDLGRQGLIVANGPFDRQSDQRYRGLSVYSTDVNEARRLAEADPMVRAGRLAVETLEWRTAAGSASFGSPGSTPA